MPQDDTRTRILNAAGTIFAEQGFQNATIRQISRLAEVNLASVNYHFGDKERLYVEAFRYALQFRTQQVPLPQWPEGTPAEVKLRDFIRSTIRRMLEVQTLPWQGQLMMREMLQPSGACRELVQSFVRPHFEQMLSILDELVPADTPEPRRHKLAFSLIGQCLFYRFHEPVIQMLVPASEQEQQHLGPESIAEHITQVMLAALGRQPLFAAGAQERVL